MSTRTQAEFVLAEHTQGRAGQRGTAQRSAAQLSTAQHSAASQGSHIAQHKCNHMSEFRIAAVLRQQCWYTWLTKKHSMGCK